MDNIFANMKEQAPKLVKISLGEISAVQLKECILK